MLWQKNEKWIYKLDSYSWDISDNDNYKFIIEKINKFIKYEKTYFAFHSHLWKWLYVWWKNFFKLNFILNEISKNNLAVSFELPYKVCEYYHQYKNTRLLNINTNTFEIKSKILPISKITIKTDKQIKYIITPNNNIENICFENNIYNYFYLEILPWLYKIKYE